MTNETAFSMDTSSIKYGPGVTREVGYEMRRLGAPPRHGLDRPPHGAERGDEQ